MSTPFSMTAEQHQAIHSLDQDCIVSAGAGSGKTRVLVERYLAILDRHRSEPECVDWIVAITFTEKAATEMKDRIRLGIRQRMEAAQIREDSEEAAGWYRFLVSAERIRVSTIHSFCTTLLREHPVEADVDPAFGVLDEREAALLLREAVAERLVSAVKAMEGNAPASLATLWGLSGLRTRFSSIYTEMAGNGWDPATLSDRTFQHFSATVEQLQREFPKALAEVKRSGEALQQVKGGKKATDFQREWSRFAVGLEGEATAMEVLPLLEEISGLLGGNWGRKEEVILPRDQMKEAVSRAWQIAGSLAFSLEEESILRWVIQVMEEVDAKYKGKKEERNRLDFDELQFRAVTLLREHPRICREVRSRIRYLMVDEYQDTNEAQKQLIDLLRLGPEGERIPGKLFVVGDPKQSIYRFRGAEVAVFGRTRDEILQSGGKEVALVDNFRSDGALVEFINGLFSKLMTGAPGEANHYPPARASRPVGDGPRVEFLAVEVAKSDPRKVEAAAIARRICELAEEGIPYGGIAVLFQAMTHVKGMEEALIQEGIPCHVVGGSGFFAQQEILDMLHLMRVLEDPTDTLAMVGVLRSPFCGVSDETLLRLAQEERWVLHREDWMKREGLPLEESRKLELFLHQLERSRRIKGQVPVADLLSDFLEQSGYIHVIWSTPQGKQARANLDKFLLLLRQWKDVEATSLRSILEKVERLTEIGDRETEASVEVEGGNSVRLMSIHQSKGLEFPVVFIPDLSRKPLIDIPDLKLDREAGLVARLVDETGEKRDPFRWQQVMEREQARSREEWVRLFYVATTRAEQRLILSGIPEEHKGVQKGEEPLTANTWSKWLDGVLGFHRIDWERGIWNLADENAEVAVRLCGDSQFKERDKSSPLLEDLTEDSPSQSPSFVEQMLLPRGFTDRDRLEVSVTDLVTLIGCPRRYYFEQVAGMPAMEEREPFSSGSSEGGAEGLVLDPRIKGQIVHRLLEKCNESLADGEDWKLRCLEVLEEWRVPGEWQSRAWEEIRPLLVSYLNSRFYLEQGRQAGLKNECRFIRRSDGLEVEGVLDRIHCTPDGVWELVDYKTNDISEERVEEVAQEYLPQLQLYALAAREEWGIQAGRAILFFLKPNRCVEYQTDPEWMEQAEKTLREAAYLLQQGQEMQDFPLRPGRRCSYCDFRNICEGGAGL
ncbi:ATP-dependent helicase/nuclease subunit A [Kroppenstedtia sanguinis]|uniref:UvrD-helicase domain-containing protein n=1 Tax=Kroppenstedtia sanguinis TaxID=1380684 RepID=UPI003D252346